MPNLYDFCSRTFIYFASLYLLQILRVSKVRYDSKLALHCNFSNKFKIFKYIIIKNHLLMYFTDENH